jgi:Holliday junction resolvase-like predicted endonuclease
MLGWRSRLGFIDITVKEQGFSMLIELRSGNEGPVAD